MTNINLATLTLSQGFKISASNNAQLGYSISPAGDFNGDGIDDIIVGLPRYNQAAIIYGQNTTLPNIVIDSLASSQGIRITTNSSDSSLGIAVSNAGDFNGDTIADVIVGTGSGSAYVLYGKQGGYPTALDLTQLDPSQGFKLLSAQAFDLFGTAACSAGDTNGDGIDDIVIAAPSTKVGIYQSMGLVNVIYGGWSYSNFNMSQLNSTQGYTISGINSLDGFGSSCAFAGDFNNDGHPDFIVGAPSSSTNKAGYGVVLYGQASNSANLDLNYLATNQGVIFYGETNKDFTGYSVGGGKDINGDSIPDVIIGAYNASPSSRAQAGKVFVCYGKNGVIRNTALSSLKADQGHKYIGASASGYTGSAVALIGDINGDGIADIMIGADANYFKYTYGSTSTAPKTYILNGYNGTYGTSTQTATTFDLLTVNSTILLAPGSRDNTGVAVSSAGDINKDGIEDYMVGSNLYSGTTGLVTVIYGTNGESSTTTSTSSPTHSVSPSLSSSSSNTVTASNTATGTQTPSITPSNSLSSSGASSASTSSSTHLPASSVSPSSDSITTSGTMTTSNSVTDTNTPSPTASITASLTITPSSSTTPSPSPFTTQLINGEGSYVATTGRVNFIINSNASVIITASDEGNDRFTISPNNKMNITITNFNQYNEQIDLSLFSDIFGLNDINITQGSAIIHLPQEQKVILQNLNPSDISNDNFIFQPSSTQQPTHTGVTSGAEEMGVFYTLLGAFMATALVMEL